MSFASASMAMQGIGAASSVVGSYYAAESQKSSLGFQAGIADINARMAEQSAQGELLRGEREYQSSRLRTAQLKGRQRASLAANGVDLGVGSAAEILTSTDVMGETDANTIQANAIKSAWGHRTQATSQQNDALMKRASASSISPGSAAFSSLLSEGGKMGSSYLGMKKDGLFSTGAAATPTGVSKSAGDSTTYSGTPLTSNWG
jgi:hypothetical protein